LGARPLSICISRCKKRILGWHPRLRKTEVPKRVYFRLTRSRFGTSSHVKWRLHVNPPGWYPPLPEYSSVASDIASTIGHNTFLRSSLIRAKMGCILHPNKVVHILRKIQHYSCNQRIDNPFVKPLEVMFVHQNAGNFLTS